MFIPKKFSIEDKNEIYSFIETNAFGQLISNKHGRLLSSHLPFLLSADKKTMIGHLAKLNPQANDLDQQNVLITLQGAHDYISPTWYTNAGVPTWNYQAVHIYGKCETTCNPETLQDIVNTLSTKYELNSDEPWQPNYNPAMLGAIVGFEIYIDDIQCQYKLSQNRTEQERKNVIKQLEKRGSSKLAQAMIRNEIKG